ncbi:MAG: arsenate reductase (glutaredoxin) [Rhodospirillaceae bacterium]|nr:arsenate reductase (glutaredoxin) [Rhodospirillaceae bacterium]
MTVTIYYNPSCSKCRTTLALLEEKGADPEIVEYLSTPPDAATLKGILEMLGIGPRGLLRKKEAAEAGLDDASLDGDALIAAMVANPAVIERPIVVADGKARIGRPPENVLDIL